jgi:hypothetical protein
MSMITSAGSVVKMHVRSQATPLGYLSAELKIYAVAIHSIDLKTQGLESR